MHMDYKYDRLLAHDRFFSVYCMLTYNLDVKQLL